MARHNRKHDRRKHSLQHPDFALQETFLRRIRTVLEHSPHQQALQRSMPKLCNARSAPASFQAAVQQALREGIIRERGQHYVLCDGDGSFPAEIIRLSGGMGFLRDAQETEYFVPGKYLRGSMPGDKVLARNIPSRSDDGLPSAEVLLVTEEAKDVRISGMIVPTERGLCLFTMNLCMRIDYRESVPYKSGDKVLCVLTSRGLRHTEHRVKVILNFGSAECAGNCIQARIAEQNIPTAFPQEVLHDAGKLAEMSVTAFDTEGRLDLREECIFTIDGAHSKDLDDAVSLRQHEDGSYTLGVHIADVSHYVRGNTPLDREAYLRGTSIYYADKVIPMLPPALSNGICSLNAGEDRLTISAILHLSPEGELRKAEFHKSVIRSRVRGVYTECNAVLEGTADAALCEKYGDVTAVLRLLDELTDKLERLRTRRGAPALESTEYELLLDENGICTGVTPVQRGRSEHIIEACMLCANEAAARLAREREIPFVYRVHENPSPDRIAQLREMLLRFGKELRSETVSPEEIRKMLEDCKDEPYFPTVNMMTLRAMAKARYSPEPLGHFGLALHDYAHFTSPIRRYADLAVHRILTDCLAGGDKEWMAKRYSVFADHAAQQASDTELRAQQLEREADSCYAAEYMQAHLGEVFHGVVTSIQEYGMYIMLDNHVEGLLPLHDLPEGEYELHDGWYLKDTLSGREFRLGMTADVVCARADVNTGHVDLVLYES